MSIPTVFIAVLGVLLTLEGIRFTLSREVLPQRGSGMTVDDLLAYRVMFGGVQLALGVYMIVSLFLLSERSSQLLLSAVIFTTVGVYRIAGFTFAKASKKQFWFGIAELGLGVVAAAIMF